MEEKREGEEEVPKRERRESGALIRGVVVWEVSFGPWIHRDGLLSLRLEPHLWEPSSM